MELVDLWTWDDDVGECIHFKDCVGPYGQLEENVYTTRFECERNCAHFQTPPCLTPSFLNTYNYNYVLRNPALREKLFLFLGSVLFKMNWIPLNVWFETAIWDVLYLTVWNIQDYNYDLVGQQKTNKADCRPKAVDSLLYHEIKSYNVQLKNSSFLFLANYVKTVFLLLFILIFC